MLRLRFFAQSAFIAFTLCNPPEQAWAQPKKVEYRDIQNLVKQKSQIEDRIADLQRRIDEAMGEKTYCTSEERQADIRNLRNLQREAAALGKEYGDFKSGFIKLASNPAAGPHLDEAGVHPDDRKYWADDDKAVATLRQSALAKANRVENAPIVDCSEKKTSTTPSPAVEQPSGTMLPPEKKKDNTPKPISPPPPIVNGPTAPLGGPLPTGCTEKERTERRLRIQDEILRLERELIPIDGTKPEGRARQLQLRSEIDRLAGLLNSDCPPLLPNESSIGPAANPQPQPAPEKEKPAKVTPTTGSHTSSLSPAKQEFDTIELGLSGLMVAFAYSGGCDQQQLQKYIAGLESYQTRARALAAAVAAADVGGYSMVNADRVQKLIEHLQRHIDEAKEVGAVDCPAGVKFQMSPWDGKIIAVLNRDRAEVGAQPLHWDPVLAAHAKTYANELARTGQLQHASRESRGIERENLGTGRIGSSPDSIISNQWSSEKRNFIAGYYPNVARDGNWQNVSHHTQDVWPTTTDVGCGWSIGSGLEWVVCRFSPGGNKDGQPVGYRDPATYSGGPLDFNPTYSPVLKKNRPVNPDKLDFGDEAVAEWKNFEFARNRCTMQGIGSSIEKLKYYSQAAHEHSVEERTKGDRVAADLYGAMAKQLDERITDAEAYRAACERDPYRYQERG